MTNHPNRNWRRRAIARAVGAVREALAALPAGAELDVALVVYLDDRTFLTYRLRDWPNLGGAAEHHAFIESAIRPAIEAEGASTHLVTFDPTSYEVWRAANGVDDSDSARAAWAALQP